jgi:diacylglycerol kinase (ATP)
VLLLSRETHFRVQWVSAILAIGLGGFVGLSLVEWCVLVLAVGLVWVAEGMNTALEHLADAVTREHHPLIGSAKDIAAAAVLIASGASVVVGALLFLPKVLR